MAPVSITVLLPDTESVLPGEVSPRLAVMISGLLPSELLSVYEVPVRLPFWIVLPAEAALLMFTAPTVWLVPPKSSVPPPIVNAAVDALVDVPNVPEPEINNSPAFAVVVPTYVLSPDRVSSPAVTVRFRLF